MNEQDFKHGAIHQPIRRRVHRIVRKARGYRLARGMGVDWNAGSPFRHLWQGKLSQKNQGQNSSCGGQAASEFLQLQDLIRGGAGAEISAKSVYAPIAFPGGGTTVQALQQHVGTVGANLEKDVRSYFAGGTPFDEVNMTERSYETVALTQDALQRAGYTPYDIHDDIESVADAIATYGAVFWMITGQNGNSPDWRSPTPQPPAKNNPNPRWRHFMMAHDFCIKDGQKTIIAVQSEGPTWGEIRDGISVQYFADNYFNDTSILDAFTFIRDTNIKPKVDNTTLWADLCRWFRKNVFNLPD